MFRTLLLIFILSFGMISQSCAVLAILEKIDGSSEEEVRRIRMPKAEVWNEVDKYKAENIKLNGQLNALIEEKQKIKDEHESKISRVKGQNRALNQQIGKLRDESQILAKKISKSSDMPPSTELKKKKTPRVIDNSTFDASQNLTYSLQVGAFLSARYAEDRKAKLIKMGYEARLMLISDKSERIWNTVRISEYDSRKEALEAAVAFSENEQMEVAVVPFSSF